MRQQKTMSVRYGAYLETIKKSKKATGKDNFFDYNNLEKFVDALHEEISYINKNKGPDAKKLDNAVKTLENGKMSDNNVDELISQLGICTDAAIVKNAKNAFDKAESGKKIIEALKKYRLESGKGLTSFMTFSENVLNAVKTYLNNTKDVSLKDFREKYVPELRAALLKALKEYRHSSKSYHRFSSSVGRAQIANKLMGPSLELWINNSFKALETVGRSFKVNQNQKYSCTKIEDDDKGKTGYATDSNTYYLKSKVVKIK